MPMPKRESKFNHVMVLNDGETFTNLQGCAIVKVPANLDLDEIEITLAHGEKVYVFASDDPERILRAFDGMAVVDCSWCNEALRPEEIIDRAQEGLGHDDECPFAAD